MQTLTLTQFIQHYQGILDEETVEKLKLLEKEEMTVEKLTGRLYVILFPEETDFMYDSTFDAIDRKKGINPMKKSYTKKHNDKRIALGLPPLDNSGLSTDTSAFEFCKRLIENSNSNK